MQKPKLCYNNILRDAQTGNDGTIYGSCSEAVADDSDAFKVRGEILPSADIASIATLEGCGVVFDETKNEYKITDSGTLLRYVENNILIPDKLYCQCSVIIGSYLYVGCNTGGAGIIVKINLTNLTESDYLMLEPGIYTIASFDYVAASGLLYVGITTAPSTIVVVNISSFSQVDSLLLNTGENVICAAKVYGENLYAVCRNGSAETVVVKVDISVSPISRIQLYTLDPADLIPTCADLYGSNLIIGCQTIPSRAVKFDLVTLTRTGALIFTAGENSVKTILTNGSSVLAGCGTSPGILVKIDPSPATPTRTGALTLNAGENDIKSLCMYGTALLAGCNTTAGKVVKIDPSPANPTRTGVLTLNAGENAVYTISTDGTSAYCGCYTASAIVVKIDPSPANPTRTSSLTLPVGEDNVVGADIWGSSLLIGLNMSPGRIIKYDLTTFTRLGSLTLNAGENSVLSLKTLGDYVYAGCYTATGIVVKIDPSGNTPVRIGSCTLNAGENEIMAIESYGANLLVSCKTSPGKIVKIDPAPANPTRLGVLTLNAGENEPWALKTIGTAMFVGCWASPGIVVKIDPAPNNPTRTGFLALDAAEEYVVSLESVGTALFAGCLTSPGKIVKIDPAPTNPTRTGVLTLEAGENNVRAMRSDGTYLYAGVVGTVIKINPSPSNPTRLASVTLPTENSGIRSVSFYADYLYTGHDTYPGAVCKIDTLAYFSLFERLQDADIGDSFTIRAGLTCAQAAATRPAIYAADGHLSPRFIGTVNTEHKIRTHSPSCIEDGGFESGAFLPNWTAEAGWTVISSADKLEGAYSANWDLVGSKYLMQSVTEKLEKGTTYTLLLKAKSLTANPTTGAITIQVKNTGSGTNIDADLSGTTPAITTTATWFSLDIVPDFETDNWYIKFLGDHTKANGATAVIIDEVYLYEKLTIDSLIVHAHNWTGRGPIIVNAWRLSPLRSTSAVDANNKVQLASFTPDISASINQTLTSNSYPVFEIVLPAVSGWTPEAGEIRISDTWTLPKYPQPLDPYETIEGGLREFKLDFRNLPPAYRAAQIERLFEKLRQNESVDIVWDTDAPVLVEDSEQRKSAPYNPYLVDFTRTLRERP